MGTILAIRLILWLLFTSISASRAIVYAKELSLEVSENATLQLVPGLIVEKSPGSKPGIKMLCERVQIHGFSRLKHLKKFANSVKVKVTCVNTSGHQPNVDVCFHRNMTIGIGMCPQGQWVKLTKGSWIKSMSPFDNKLLDIRMAGSSAEPLQVSLDEEFYLYRVILLVSGIVLMTLATFLSKSLVFYYGGAMTVGILLVILLVLFQGMRLLPTGRKNSLAIFIYSCIVGLGSFLLRYIPRLLHSFLIEIGIGEDMYNPLATFLLVFLVLVGAWLGFWVVRKLVLTEDGDIDVGVSHFVAWSIRFIASVMILQSSLDPLLAAVALLCGIVISSILRRFANVKSIHRFYRRLCSLGKNSCREFPYAYVSPVQKSRNSTPLSGAPRSKVEGSTSRSPRQMSNTETFYSTFHATPERKKFSKDEWDEFTKESTKKALEGLVSSPDFNRWAVTHADRITLAPEKGIAISYWRQRWFNWF